jgi:hypothetical protein
MHRRLGGPQNRSGRRAEEKIMALPGLEFRPLGRPTVATRYTDRTVINKIIN